MIAVMVITLPTLATTGLIRHVRVSLPRVDALLNEPGNKYQLPENMPPPAGLELRAMMRPRIAQAKAPPKAPRAPSLRSLVKLALACESAEEMGKKLKQRFDRQQQRRGVYARRDPTARDLAEIDRLIGRP
jgi:hypothetical protein